MLSTQSSSTSTLSAVNGASIRLSSCGKFTPQKSYTDPICSPNEKVVGWCDVTPKHRPAFLHCGILGMGVVEPHRGRGIGTALMDATLKAARAKGLTRVELTVRVDNERAKKLYERFDFVTEGVCKRHILINGEYADSYYMAALY